MITVDMLTSFQFWGVMLGALAVALAIFVTWVITSSRNKCEEALMIVNIRNFMVDRIFPKEDCGSRIVLDNKSTEMLFELFMNHFGYSPLRNYIQMAFERVVEKDDFLEIFGSDATSNLKKAKKYFPWDAHYRMKSYKRRM
jgi:hypothetical protein